MMEAKMLSTGIVDASNYARERSGMEKSSWAMDNLMRFLVTGPETKWRTGKESSNHEIEKGARQAMLLRLLNKLSRNHYDESSLIHLVIQERMNRKFRNSYKKLVIEAYRGCRFAF